MKVLYRNLILTKKTHTHTHIFSHDEKNHILVPKRYSSSKELDMHIKMIFVWIEYGCKPKNNNNFHFITSSNYL